MGGIGSGRQWRGGSYTVEEHRSIDVRRWKRGGFLEPGRWFGWQWSNDDGERLASINAKVEETRVVLSYRSKASWEEEWTDVEQSVPLEWTACHLGGQRPWFRCAVWSNGMYCGRRVAKLYAGGTLFACRHCYRLSYESQGERPYDRALSKAQKIRMRLGGSPATCDPFPPKPKHMHWKTYWRLYEAADEAERLSWIGVAERFGGLISRYD